MPEAYTVIRSLEEFSAARKQFNVLVSRLQSEEMGRMEHGEVEATIAHEGIGPGSTCWPARISTAAPAHGPTGGPCADQRSRRKIDPKILDFLIAKVF
ncbi:MAG: hypothetical protein ACREAZ_10315 [Nitrososphaera sp.]